MIGTGSNTSSNSNRWWQAIELRHLQLFLEFLLCSKQLLAL